MAVLQFELLDHNVPGGSFKCGNGSIESLIEQAYYENIVQHAYTYQFMYNGKLLGYYMILFRKIKLENTQNVDEDIELFGGYSSTINYCTSVHIEFLAVDKQYQKQKIGTGVLKKIIQDIMNLSIKFPIRLITIEALNELKTWYENIGFTVLKSGYKEETTLMYIDCLSGNNKQKIEEYTEV